MFSCISSTSHSLVVRSKEKAKPRVGGVHGDEAVVKDLCVHLLFAIPFLLALVTQKEQGKSYG